MLFNEPKLLKSRRAPHPRGSLRACFSALQRAEIAEMTLVRSEIDNLTRRFSALQRAEIAEIRCAADAPGREERSFSALQRAEIAEMTSRIPARTSSR